MFAMIMALVALIVITPNFLGHPTELASWPILIVALVHDQTSLLIDVTSFSQPYRYDNITLNVSYETLANVTVPFANQTLTDAYSGSLYVPTQVNNTYDVYRNSLDVHTKLVDRQGNYFELNVTVRLSFDANNKPVMAFHFPDDTGSTAAVQITPPDDFRWPVPRKGVMP